LEWDHNEWSHLIMLLLDSIHLLLYSYLHKVTNRIEGYGNFTKIQRELYNCHRSIV